MRVQIKDLGKVITGRTPPGSTDGCYGGKTPFLTPSDQEFGSRRVITERTLSNLGTSILKNNLVPKGSTSVTCIGATIGKMNQNNTETITNQQINTVIPGAEYDPDFVYYLMLNNASDLKRYAAGAATPILSKSKFEEIEIEFGDEVDQTKVGKFFSSLDDLIEINKHKIKSSEQIVRLLYKEWFVNFKFPGHEKVKMVDSGHPDFGMIPDGWNISKVGDICERIFSGGTPSTQIKEYWDGKFSWLSSGETREKWVIETEKTITKDGIDNSSTRFVPKNSIVIASAGQGKTRGQTSLLCLDAYINQSVIAMIANSKKATPLFLHTFFQLNYDTLRQLSDSSSSRGSLTIPDLKQLNILVPPLELQNKMPNIDELIPVLMKQNKNLTKLRDLLLPKLISGEIDFSEFSEIASQKLAAKKSDKTSSERTRL